MKLAYINRNGYKVPIQPNFSLKEGYAFMLKYKDFFEKKRYIMFVSPTEEQMLLSFSNLPRKYYRIHALTAMKDL